MNEYFGKYRGVVTNINDPNNMGRIRARVPAVTEEFQTGWCLPCLPFAGQFKFLPSVGDCVWIEFERGKIDYPIWSGMWYAKGKDTLNNLTISTSSGTITFSGGDVNLTNTSGQTLNVSSILKKFDDLRDWCNRTFRLK